jgi:hypothetical protein
MTGDSLEICFAIKRNLTWIERRVPQAQTFAELGLDPSKPNFAESLLVEMNRATRIHFNISDMNMINTQDGVLFGPAEYNSPGSTNWELRTIWDNPSLKIKTVFYRNGRIISSEDLISLPV